LSQTPPSDDTRLLFAVFNEIAIIEQLARNRFERALPEGLLMPHFGVLNHLVRLGDGRSLAELARAFQVVKSAMTNTVQRLAARGLVEVRPDPEDGRGKRVYLTLEGRALRERSVAAVLPLCADILRVLDPASFAAALPFLSELRAMLDRGRGEVPPVSDLGGAA
jgi:DNA-binding MarR family transcriptional regulator